MGHFLTTFLAVALGMVVGGALLMALLYVFGYFIVPQFR